MEPMVSESSKNHSTLVATLKCDSLKLAKFYQIPIIDGDGVTVGNLIPVGNWILDDEELIQSICDWRKRDMKNFFVQFESSFSNTREYLINFSIKKQDRLFFIITDLNERFLGHIGISNIRVNEAELDNMIRGERGGPRNLIELAEKTLINFSKVHLGIDKVTLKVMSFNFLALQIHQRLGFIVSAEIPLVKTASPDGTIHHANAMTGDSNVPYKCLALSLDLSESH